MQESASAGVSGAQPRHQECTSSTSWPQLVKTIFPGKLRDLPLEQKNLLFPNLCQLHGNTKYAIATTEGIKVYMLKGGVTKVKEEDIGLANRKTRYKKSWRRRMALAVTTEPKKKHRLLHKMLSRIRKKLASKQARRNASLDKANGVTHENKCMTPTVGHVLETSGRGQKRAYEKPEIPEKDVREAKFFEIKSDMNNPELHRCQKRGRWGSRQRDGTSATRVLEEVAS